MRLVSTSCWSRKAGLRWQAGRPAAWPPRCIADKVVGTFVCTLQTKEKIGDAVVRDILLQVIKQAAQVYTVG